ncbi:MAG: M3 family oligoendopeptidase [bacterium]|nr:M3 family oligoendopeptidase [bacterium]
MAEAMSEQETGWDLSSFFPEFNGPEMVAFKETLQKDLDGLQKRAAALPGLLDENQTEWETVFVETEELLTRLHHLGSYVGCLTAADARNESYQREEAAFSLIGAAFSKLQVELLRGIKETPEEVFDAFVSRAAFEGADHGLRQMRRESRFTMSADREALAADLGVDGLHAWGRLYDGVSGKLEFEMVYPDGRKEQVPMAQRRSLMEDTDRKVRRAAFEGGNAAWEGVETVAAAALNAISGTRLTLNRYREIPHFLEVALFQSGITRKTLDAMFEAIFSEVELGRRIFRLKADAMGTKGVAWYDLGAPLPIPNQEVMSWERAKSLVKDSFSRAYPELGTFLQHMYDQRWIEWEPRPGKRPGAFCTGSLLTRESRVFMTYNRTLGDALTLAHEAGHAFHSYMLREMRPFATDYPMTLAESASTFGEMILADGAMADPALSEVQKALMLDVEVGHGAIYLMDIPVRYEFEKAMYEERMKGELSVSQIKELMAQTQRRVFGDVLEEGGEDPYFWASKLHFYITGVTFYNFPYTFGYLLSRGLFAMFKQEGPAFLPRYEDFLRLTGSDTVENVAQRSIGQDLEQPDFWVKAIRSLEEPLAKLEAVLPNVMPSEGRS